MYDQVQPAHFALTAQIQGEFSSEQLKRALMQVQQRHPLLRVRIALDETEQPWFVEEVANIPLRVLQRQSEQHWQREVETEISTPFNWKQAPLIRAVLLHSPEISELIVVYHHSIADGTSGAYLIQDILQAIAVPSTILQPLPMPLSLEELMLGKADAALPDYPVALQSSDFKPPETSSRSRLLAGSLTPETTGELISRCRQEQTSVHAAICAAFLLAIARQSGSKQQQTLKCLTPIDLQRRFMSVTDTQFSLYLSAAMTSHALTPNTSVWAVAQSVKQQLNSAMEPDRVMAAIQQTQAWMSANPSAIQVWQGFIEQYGGDITVTNLGRLAIPQQFGQLQLRGIYGPSVMPSRDDGRLLGVATVGERLCFTLVYPESVLSPTAAAQLQQDAMQLLHTAIASTSGHL
ncbi:phthiocerol/phthiodiolone dimycocerosyl transferase family protein [Chroococcidiopsis sp.]|uniref:phthiocerol/phthiodiolone dimycocerosyl transferase family protein n=1 Tax=Chroococcidiopsis sp. TaxID=3088168 RepID=UPI003F2A0484